MTALRLVIRGRVQGVGYREWASRTARSLGLSGWVRNRSDGSVEALVDGNIGAVERFAEACLQGPPAARVSSVDQHDGEPAAPRAFKILPTL